MKHTKMKIDTRAALAAALLLWAAGGFSLCPAQTTKPKAGGPKWPSRYDITVKVPEILRKHLASEFLDLATKTYPQADADLIRADMKTELLCEEYTFQVGRASGVSRSPKEREGKSKVRFFFYLPLRGLSVYTWITGVPTGMKVQALDKPLTLDQAKPIAESTMKRVFPDPREFGRMKMFESFTERGKFASHSFRFKRAGTDAAGQELTVQIFVWPNGVIRQVSLRRTRTVAPTPKVPFKEIAARAEKSIPRFDPAYLKHRAEMYYSKPMSFWRYAVPARPAGQPEHVTHWDAETGKLIFSEVIKGGTPRKPYRNPDFYFEPTEKAVRSHLEKLVADAARKLEQAQKGPAATSRSATTRTQPADDGPESRPTLPAANTKPTSAPASSWAREAASRPRFSRPEQRGEDLSGQPTPVLIRRLSLSQDKIEQRKAAKVLGDRYLRGVLKLSASDKKMLDGYIRRQCALAAAPVGNDRSEADNQIQRLWRLSTDVLLESLDSDKIAVSEAAAKNLALMRNEAIIGALIAKIRDGKNPTGRRMAVFAFLVMNDTLESVVPGRTSLDLRSSRLLEDKHIIPFLVAIQKGDKDPVVRSLAEQSLQAFKKSRGGK